MRSMFPSPAASLCSRAAGSLLLCLIFAAWLSGTPSHAQNPIPAPLLAATSANGSVSLNWTPIKNVDGYYIYRSTTPGAETDTAYAKFGGLGPGRFTDFSVSNGTTYYYKVAAFVLAVPYNKPGIPSVGARSNEAFATPGATTLPGPTGLTGTPAVDGAGQASVTLAFNPVAGAVSYDVYAGTDPTNLTLKSAGLLTTSYTDLDVKLCVTYYYEVAAVGQAGEGARSQEISLTPTGFKPAAPTLSPNGGVFDGTVSVSLKDATPGALIYYTTDGSAPSAASTLYTVPFTLSATATVRAVAVFGGCGVSDVIAAAFTKLALQSLSAAPANVMGGVGAVGTVTLNGPAPADGATVALSSGNPAASVPAAVAVPAGQASATFPISTTPVSGDTPVTLSASFEGVTVTAPLTVTGCRLSGLASFSVSPTSVTGGAPATGTVTLSGPAPAGGESASLQSSSGAAQAPASVFVPAGQTNVTFPISTLSIGASTTVTLTASYHGVQKTTSLTVTPAPAAGAAGSGSGSSTTGTGLILTPAGVAEGFQLSTFVTGITSPTNCVVTSAGTVLVSGFNNTTYILPSDTDGQSVSASTPTVSNNVFSMASDGTHIYGHPEMGPIYELNPDGTVKRTVTNSAGGYGIAVNPVNGHILAGGIIDIDPNTNPITSQVVGSASPDGITVSGDGRYVFAANYFASRNVLGFDIASHAQVFDSGPIAGGVDGLATGGGTLAGKIYGNANSGVYNNVSGGTVVEIDTTTGQQTIIAYGGSRGDLASVDLSNGTFLLSQSDRVMRLIPPPGGNFGGGESTIHVRDDLPHRTSATNPALTSAYSAFTLSSPQTLASSGKSAAFDITGLGGRVMSAQMQRAGQLTHDAASRFDLQWGLTSLATGTLTSFGPVQEAANALPSPAAYQVIWPLPSAFLPDIQDQLGSVYNVSLTDLLSSLCGSYTVADQPQQNWPTGRNTLTVSVSGVGTPQIPQGRALDVTVPGADSPVNGAWDVVLNGQVVASSVSPQGWNLAEDHTEEHGQAFHGIVVSVPLSAAVANNYEIRCQGLDTAGSAYFGVVAAGTPSRAPVLLPLVLQTNPVVGGTAVTGTVTLDAPAPAGGATVALTSGNPALATVPVSVTVAAGHTSATFPVTTQSVSSPVGVSVGASYNGYRKRTLVMTDSAQAGDGTVGGTADDGDGFGLPAGAPAGGSGGGLAPGHGLGGGILLPPSKLSPPALTASASQIGTPARPIVSLTWISVPKAAFYALGRSTRKGGPYTLLAITTALTFTDRKVVNGTTYYYVADAGNIYGESGLSNEASATPVGGKVATPVISPHGGTFTGSVQVTLSDATPLSYIHYTTDGSDPAPNSPVYSSAFTLSASGTVKARAFKDGYITSDVAGADFTIQGYQPPPVTPITCGQTISGSLGASYGYGGGSSTVQGNGFYAHDYTFAGKAGEAVTITAASSVFDAVIYLLDPAGNVVSAAEDNGGGAQIAYTLQTSGMYTIEVTSYAPGATGAYTLSLGCTGADGVPQLAVSIGGTSVPNGATPSSVAVLDFGSTPVGMPVNKTFTVSNVGAGALTISQVGVPGGFTLTQPPTSPVAPGASTTFVLRFDAGSVGPQSGSLTLRTNDTAQDPFTVTVSGTATGSTSSNPKIPQGTCLTFPSQYYYHPYNATAAYWYIYDPSGTKIASDSTLDGPGPSGWTAASTDGGAHIQVCAPTTASIATGYRVEVSDGSTYTAVAYFDVVSAGPLLTTLTFTPNPVVGGNTATGIVTLSRAATSDATVTLTSQNTAVATLPQSSVVIPAGSTTSSGFTVNTVAVSSPTDAPIQASYNNGTVTSTLTGTLTVTQTPTVAAPVITGTDALGRNAPSGGRFNGTLTVTLQCATHGASIRYTLDGTDPTAASTLYSGPFPLTAAATVKAKAFLTGYTPSATASATFTPNTPPSVSLTSPANGAAFQTGDNVPVKATASDADGSVLRVDFFADPGSGNAIKIGSAAAIPYAITWNGAPAGSYALTAVATDNDGAVTTSVPVSITIGSSTGSTTPTPIACGQTLSGSLSATDAPSGVLGQGFYADHYTFTGIAGQTVIISLKSTAFDAYLALIGPSRAVVATNDDSNNSTSDAQIVYTIPAGGDGTYTIEATSYAAGATGPYTLALDCSQGSAAPVLSVTVDGAAVHSGDTVSFGSTPQGTPVTKTFVLTNTGNADLTISSFNGTGDWSPAGTLPPLLHPGDTASFALRFNATNPGAASGTADLGNNSAQNPFHILLSGMATMTPTVDLATLAVTPSPVSGGAKVTVTATLTGPAPSGGQSVALTTSSAAVPVPTTMTVLPNQTSGSILVTTRAVAAAITVTVTGRVTATQTASVTVNPSGTPPTVSLTAPTPGQTFTAPASIAFSATAAAQTAGATIARVEFFQGTVKVGEADASPYAATWSNVPAGTYSLTARATDSNGLSSTSSPAVSVTVGTQPAEQTPQISASPAGTTFTSFPTITLSDPDTNPGVDIFYTTDNSDPTTASTRYTQPFALAQTGSVSVKAKAFRASLAPSATAVATYTITAGTPGSKPDAQFTSPGDGAALMGPTDVHGTVTGSGQIAWEMDYQAEGDTTWTPFASGTLSSPSGAAVAGHLDTTLLLNGLYELRLTAVDTAGQTVVAPLTLTVKGDQKIGYFTVSFEDLSTTLAGLPIQVTRTYDSRDKSAGDFGVGWTLSLTNARLQTSGGEGGYNWNEIQRGASFSLQEARPHHVTITLPNGDLYDFIETTPFSNTPQNYSRIDNTTILYQQVSGPKATLTPVDADPNDVYVAQVVNNDDPNSANASAVEFYAGADLNAVYNPTEFLLTTHDGRKIDIKQGSAAAGGGLKSITDRNGNVITFSPNSISSSDGKQIQISRVGGVITAITDLNGNTISYAQDGVGNLASVTDRAKNTTTFDYDPTHLLTGIHDPTGRVPLRNFYTPDGRLDYTQDADGHRVNYSYNLGSNQEITQDALGNQTVLGYDGYGNVTSTTKYLNGRPITTTAQFGDPNNPDKPTNQVDALGRATDYAYDQFGSPLTVTRYRTKGDASTAITTTMTYNGFGQLLTVTDGLGKTVTTNAYDAQGNLKSTMDALGHATTFAYNPDGSLKIKTDAKSNPTGYAYDSNGAPGNLTQVTDASGHATMFAYDGDGNKTGQSTTRTNALGQTETLTTQFVYDAADRLIQTTTSDTATSQTFYNSLGKVDHTVDAAGRATAYSYDDQRRQTGVQYPDTTTTATVYDAAGQSVLSVNRGGQANATVYDSLGRVIQSGPVNPAIPFLAPQNGNPYVAPNWLKDTNNNSIYSATTYDDAGEVLVARRMDGDMSTYVYDDLGRKTSTTDTLGHMTTSLYNDDGQQMSETDANNHTTSYDYDNAGQKTFTYYPDKTQSQTIYNELGQRVSQINQANRATSYTYDKLGRLETVTDPMGHVTQYGYDELGKKIRQTDANGHVTTFAYDQKGRLTQKTLPLGQSWVMDYTINGQIAHKSVMDEHNVPIHMTTYTYEPLTGRLSMRSDTVGGSVSFTYNSDGSRQTATRVTADNKTLVTSYTYDNRGRVQQITEPAGVISYTYDRAGNKTSTTTPSGTDSFTYDANNRLKTVRRNSNVLATYEYDKAGNRASLVRGNGVKTTYVYDALDRLTDVLNSAGGSFQYVLNPDGQRASLTVSGAQNGNGETDYAYDADGRLIQETGGPQGTIQYVYEKDSGNRVDYVGNRLQKITSGTTISYTYDANDRLLSERSPASNTLYAYDAAGRMTQVGADVYTYDLDDHVVSVTTGAGGTPKAAYSYDADGNRISQTTNTGTRTYIVDTSLPFADVAEERDANGNLLARYDIGDNLIRMDLAGGAYYYIYDGLENTRALTDETGAVTDSKSYDGFGSLIPLASTGSTVNSFLFSGQQFDGNLGLYYLRARYYAPTLGRFLSQDPFDGSQDKPASLHRYLYAENDPVNKVDPGGREVDSIAAISVGISLASISAGLGAETRWAIEGRGALYGADTRDGTPQVPTDPFDPRLRTTSQYIEIFTDTPAEKFFEGLKKFQDIGKVSLTGNGESVSHIGQVVSFHLGFPFSLGQNDFDVSVTHYDPADYFFSVQTLRGHPLRGHRYWRVEEISPRHLIIKTVAVEMPNQTKDIINAELGGAGAQQETWYHELNGIVGDIDSKSVIINNYTGYEKTIYNDTPLPGPVAIIENGVTSPNQPDGDDPNE